MIKKILVLPVLFIAAAYCQKVEISEIKNRFETFDYKNVIRLSERAIIDQQLYNEDDFIEILTMKAIAHYSLAEEESSKRSFIDILKLKNDFRLDSVKTSPKVISFFQGIKSEFLNQKDKLNKNSFSFDNPGLLQIEKNIFVNSFARSVILPGWGHLYLENNPRGWILSSLSAAAFGTMVYFIFDANSKEKKYLNETDQNLIKSKYDDYNSSFKIRNVLIAAFSSLWIYSQVDLLFFSDDLFASKINAEIVTNSNKSEIELSVKFIF
jgi:hypothetical protein